MNLDFSKVKAVFSDIDGTLLDSKSCLRERTISSVKNLKVPFFLASGRYYKMMASLHEELSLSTPLISANGGLIITKDGKVIQEYPIESGILREILNELQASYMDRIGLHLYDSKNWYCNSISSPLFSLEFRVVRCYPDVVLKDMREVSDLPISKFLLFADKPVCDELYSKWERRYGNRIHMFHEKDTMLEIFSDKASKGNGVKVLSSLYHLDLKDVLCAGDTLLDFSMLQDVGYPICMGNGSEALKKQARFIAGNTDDDGLAEILDQIR